MATAPRPRLTGYIVRIRPKSGFGFVIEEATKEEFFLHISAMEAAVPHTHFKKFLQCAACDEIRPGFQEGRVVSFEVIPSGSPAKAAKAVRVRFID